MNDTNQLPALPTPKFTETILGVPCITVTEHEHLMRAYALQASAQVRGDPSWWMRETDEGAEWTDTAPLVLSGWTPLYTTPQPAQATQAEVTNAALIRELVDHIERNTCTHEETHRGGAIWEVCDSCGARWADDEGGKPEFKWPAVVEKARAILALRPERVPMPWPKARDVGRFGDMSPSAHMRVGLDGDNDVYVSVWDETGGGSIEFCTPGAGGGSSSRTRQALIDLMVAMEEDNAERPDKDW